jgi:hypothetical protein
MPPVGLELTISAGERPKTHALDRTATGTGKSVPVSVLNRTHSTLVLSIYSRLDASALIVSHQVALQPALFISETDEGDLSFIK